MTDGTRVLRTLAIPLIPALILLFLIPRSCSKALEGRKLHKSAGPTAPVITDTQLHIQSSGPDAAPRPALSTPAGLDEQRMRYLIEIDLRFAEPAVLRIAKPGGPPLGFDVAKPAEALVAAGYFEKSENGYMPTREAALHLDGLTEDAQAWLVPVGKRKVIAIKSVNDNGEGSATVRFTWQWDPNTAGRIVKESFDTHEGTANFAGGGEHPWDLSSVKVDAEWR